MKDLKAPHFSIYDLSTFMESQFFFKKQINVLFTFSMNYEYKFHVFLLLFLLKRLYVDTYVDVEKVTLSTLSHSFLIF